jgi:hypothetical protein
MLWSPSATESQVACSDATFSYFNGCNTAQRTDKRDEGKIDEGYSTVKLVF